MNRFETNTIESLIKGNPYVGRGIVIGKTPDSKNAVIAYFIMGRSENSRNRVFSMKDDVVYTEAADPSKLEDPSLIIYNAIRSIDNKLIVTNGDQTDTIYDSIANGGTFEAALDTRAFEPDAPNFTPRISGMVSFGDEDFTYKMSILKSGDENGDTCFRQYFNYESIAGTGHFIHTYKTDGNPLPSFEGEPDRVCVYDDIDKFAKEIWDNLDSENKIALYVRYTNLENGNYSDAKYSIN